MLGAAYVVVDRQPTLNMFRVKGTLTIVRVGEAQEIPAAASETVHGVGFALCRAVTLRALHVHPLGHACQRAAAVAARLEAVHFRQSNRQLVFGHWYSTTLLAVDHRNRRAPVALTADQP